jgi:hypothetical protein
MAGSPPSSIAAVEASLIVPNVDRSARSLGHTMDDGSNAVKRAYYFFITAQEISDVFDCVIGLGKFNIIGQWIEGFEAGIIIGEWVNHLCGFLVEVRDGFDCGSYTLSYNRAMGGFG